MGLPKDWSDNSTRAKIIKPVLYNGAVPYSCLKYFVGRDTEMVRRVVRKMANDKEGILTIASTPTNKKYIRMRQLNKVPDEAKESFPPGFLDWYKDGLAIKRREKAMAPADCDRVLRNADATVFMENVGAAAYAPDRKEFLLCGSEEDYRGSYFPSYELKQQNKEVGADVFTDREGNRIVFSSGCSGVYVTDEAGYFLIYDIGRKSVRWDANEEKMYMYLQRRFVRGQNIPCSGMVFLYEDDVRTEEETGSGAVQVRTSKAYGTKLLMSVITSDENKKRVRPLLTMKNWRFEAAYFIPQSVDGIKLMQIMSKPGFQEAMKDMFLPADVFKQGHGDCDAMMENEDDGTYTFVDLFCIPNMTLLYRFYARFLLDETDRMMQLHPERKNQYVIFCFDFQENFIQTLFGGSENVTILARPFEEFLEKYNSAE